MNPARRLVVVLLTAALGLVVPAAGPAAAAPPRASTTSAAITPTGMLPVNVELTGVGPAALTPGGTLTVTGRLVNTGTSVVAGVDLSLRLREARLTTRQDVQAWSQDVAPTRVGRVLGGSGSITGLPPGTSTPFTLSVPADVMGLPGAASAFGPRGISIEVSDAAGTLVGMQRTTFVWFPGRRFQPTTVSLLVPVTASPARADVSALNASSVEAMTSQGQLGRLLSAASDRDIAWAVDPSLLQLAQQAAAGTASAGTIPAQQAQDDDATATPDSSPSATATPGAKPAGAAEGAAFLARVRSGLSGRTAYELPFADPDVAALARRRAVDETDRADGLGRAATKSVLGHNLDATLSWPGGGRADPATLGLLAESGHKQVVLDSDAYPTDEGVDHTLTGRADVTGGAATLDGLLYDADLSQQFARTGSGTGVEGTQQLVSELAALTLERPSDVRHVLITAPRGWDPQPASVTAAMAALRSVPWVTLAPVGDLRRTAPPAEGRGELTYPAAAVDAELAPELAGRVIGLDRVLARLAPAFTGEGGAAYITDLRMRAASLLSTQWRTGENLRGAVAALQDEVQGIDAGVRIAQGSTVNLLASEAEVPVVVDNTLDQALDLVLTLRPRSGQIAVKRSVAVNLPAGANRVRVLVPVEAVASGNVELEATLHTRAGDLVGSATVLDVRVRRGWEARGLGGAAAVLLLLLALGLIRGARSGRPNIPVEAVPDEDDLATERARRAQVHPDVDTQQIPRLEPDGRPWARPKP